MHFPRVIRHVNRVFTNHVFGTFACLVPPFAVIHHVGWRSGRGYRTPRSSRFTPTLRNPRIVAFEAAESRLPAFARPIFRAAALPGYVLLDE